jgi:hypothetical protein
MKKSILITVVILSLLSNVFILIYVNNQNNERNNLKFSNENRELKFQNSNLRGELKEIRDQQKYFLEVILKSKFDLQDEMPEYSQLSREKFNEAIRQKIVELRLKNENKQLP